MHRMSFRLSALVALACGFAFAPGCTSTLETFTCERNADCNSEGQPGGQCESTQVCSFFDPTCDESGQRYGNHSGEVSNQCVGGRAGEPDASPVVPPVDADPSLPDAGDSPPIDGAVPVDTDASDPTCVNLDMIVFDDNEGDDEVKVQVNGAVEHVCSPTPVPPGSDSMGACQYCMPIGASIKLKAESGAHFQALLTDCAMNCYSDNECVFTASASCNTIHYFEVEHTPIPPDL